MAAEGLAFPMGWLSRLTAPPHCCRIVEQPAQRIDVQDGMLGERRPGRHSVTPDDLRFRRGPAQVEVAPDGIRIDVEAPCGSTLPPIHG